MKIEPLRRLTARYGIPTVSAATGIRVRTLYRFVAGSMPKYETMVKLQRWAEGRR